jgi:hypothetical protein
MVMTTVHIAIAPSTPRSSLRARAEIGSPGDVMGLTVVAALVFVGGGVGAAVAAVALLGIGGSWAILLTPPGAAFPSFTALATLIWLAGAIGTRRTIRRVGPLHERADRAAFAELATLLARE